MSSEKSSKAANTRPVFITGATGFLGAWIIAQLVNEGRSVVASDIVLDKQRIQNLLSPDKINAVRWEQNDITDADKLEALIDDTKPSSIIHLAALQIPACRENPAIGAKVNILGHINIFEAARKFAIDRVIYTSSIAAKPRGPANAPSNFYGVFKKTDEEIARLYWQDHGISSLGLRPYIVYGVGRDEGETSAITKAIHAAALGEPYEMPFATRSCFQYAGEVADIFARCTQARWQGALLSDLTTEVHSTDQLIDAIWKEIPSARITPSKSVRISPSEGFDNQPVKDVIGEWPQVTLAEGTRETIRLFREMAQ